MAAAVMDGSFSEPWNLKSWGPWNAGTPFHQHENRLQAMKAQVKDLKKSLGLQAVQNNKPTKAWKIWKGTLTLPIAPCIMA